VKQLFKLLRREFLGVPFILALLAHVGMAVAVQFLWAVLRNLEGIGRHITKLVEIQVQAVSVPDTN
jgi:hypothetical protein